MLVNLSRNDSPFEIQKPVDKFSFTEPVLRTFGQRAISTSLEIIDHTGANEVPIEGNADAGLDEREVVIQLQTAISRRLSGHEVPKDDPRLTYGYL